MKSSGTLLVAGVLLFFITCISFIKNENEAVSPLARFSTEKTVSVNAIEPFSYLKTRAASIKTFVEEHGYSEKYCFLIDMNLPSGRNRFFVYDFKQKAVIMTGLVAHGSCNQGAQPQARFSNDPNCGCSSLGKYKIGKAYTGQYGKSYRLHGLESTNSNAFRRAVVLHGWTCVPDKEIYPKNLCNSLGCTMISYNFSSKISRLIDQSKRPILLWVYKENKSCDL